MTLRIEKRLERSRAAAFAVPILSLILALALIALVLQEQRSSWWLVPLFAAWVNVHGSFPLGVAFVGAMIVLRVVSTRSVGRREVSDVAAVAVGLVAGAVVSPYGFEMLTFPVELLGRSESLSFISEWRPLSLTVGVRCVRTCRRLLCRSSWCRVTSTPSTGWSSNVCRAMRASCRHAGLSSSAN